KTPPPPPDRGREVTPPAHYRPDARVLAGRRVFDSNRAFGVRAPFGVGGGPPVWVARGYGRLWGGPRAPPIPRPPADTVTITARLRNSEPAAAGKDPFVGDGVRQVYSIDTEQIAVLTKVPLAGSYLQLVDGQPGGLGVVGVPQLDAGPFLSYGIQWIAFGILAPIGVGYFAYSELRARRAEKQPAAPAAEAPQSVQDKLADRYGRRR
ncbi:SURF1 family protein, partial [Mycobacterium avium]|uniref:SURF1 family protein n=1 Tax=Mycobacterium avium TaxID=1764 RepID=UPI000C9F6345